MRVGYNNLTLEGTLIPSSITPGFPVGNLQDTRMSRQWKSLTNGVNYVDIPGLNTADYATINAHSGEAGDLFKLKGYTDSGRTTLDTTIDFDFFIYGTAKVFTEKTLYWRFEFTTNSPISVGGLFLGSELVWPDYEIGHSWSDVSDDDFFLSRTRQLYGLNPLHYRKASYLLPAVDWDQQAEVDTMWQAVGRSTPWYLLQYPDRQDLRRVFYCHFTMPELKWQEHEGNISVYKDLRIDIEEVF